MDVLLIEKAISQNSKSPVSHVECSAVCTKDKFFIVPKKTTGNFLVFNTIKNHSFFEGLSIEDGLKKMISEAESESALEDTLANLLENNPVFVRDLNTATKKSIKGFLGKKTMFAKHDKSWTSFSPKGKEATKALAAFYNF